MGARLEFKTVHERALYLCISWLQLKYEGTVQCLDVDANEGRVTLYGEPEQTKVFNNELEVLMAQVHSPMEAWRRV